MKKALQLKKEHHYVWANYLRNWSTDGTSVWFRTAKGKVIHETTKLVAKERHFYQLTHLTDEHIAILMHFISNSEMGDNHRGFMEELVMCQRFEQYLSANGQLNSEWQRNFSAHKHNAMENIHTKFENGVAEILPKLVERDLTCLDNNEDLISLFTYLGQQFARTKAFKGMSLLSMSRLDDPRAEKILRTIDECWWLWSYFIGANVGGSLYFERESYTVSLLENKTGHSFITSDHPVVNIHQELTGELGKPPEHHQFDLYYPLSPNTALVIAASDRFPAGASEISLDVVVELNSKIAEMANAHIFGETKESIQPYLKQVGKRHSDVRQYVGSR